MMHKSWIRKMIDWIRYGSLPPPTHPVWQRVPPPDLFTRTPMTVVLPPKIELPTLQWRNQFFSEHPEMKQRPVRSIRPAPPPVPHETPPESKAVVAQISTLHYSREETEKCIALMKLLHEK